MIHVFSFTTGTLHAFHPICCPCRALPTPIQPFSTRCLARNRPEPTRARDTGLRRPLATLSDGAAEISTVTAPPSTPFRLPTAPGAARPAAVTALSNSASSGACARFDVTIHLLHLLSAALPRGVSLRPQRARACHRVCALQGGAAQKQAPTRHVQHVIHAALAPSGASSGAPAPTAPSGGGGVAPSRRRRGAPRRARRRARLG